MSLPLPVSTVQGALNGALFVTLEIALHEILGTKGFGNMFFTPC
jgi:hypothetical protein